jgi:hypothetical protein
MCNVPLVFQLWENPQKKITYENRMKQNIDVYDFDFADTI